MINRRDLIKKIGLGSLLSFVPSLGFAKKMDRDGKKFSEIVEHLSKRGFVTRKLWNNQYNKVVAFYGMDNALHCAVVSLKDNPCVVDRRVEGWKPCLADLLANDWIILDCYWNGSQDDFLPIEKGLV